MRILFPINHGILYFVGFDVLPPSIAWSVSRVSQETRLGYLRDFEKRLRDWQHTTPIAYPVLEDYDEDFRLKPILS